MRLNNKENSMFKNNVFTIITAGYWSESLLKLWVTLLIIWSELMQPISRCVYCHSSFEFVVVFSVFTVVECASFCTNQSLLLHFFLSFFFLYKPRLGGSVISRNQTLAGNWLMVVRPRWLFLLLFWSDFLFWLWAFMSMVQTAGYLNVDF